MRVAVIGGGPAGLYFAYLMASKGVTSNITVFERNRSDATYGFGVVFSDAASGHLADADRRSFDALNAASEIWDHLSIVHRGERVPIDGNGFSAIARLEMLRVLQKLCADAGAGLEFGRDINPQHDLAGYDMVVAADGVNSPTRSAHAAAFGPSNAELTNRFVWYGTSQVFDTLTLTFRENADGCFVAHHYRYAPDASTFIVECDAATWERAGFERMSDAASRSYCEAVFAPDLNGHALRSNNSVWRRFPVLRNAHWVHGNTVLIGDALRSIHFSIGSGTRLAMEDAIALYRACAATPQNVETALGEFERSRRPVVEKLLAAAEGSYGWYENFGRHMNLAPYSFAHSYMTRTGRISNDRLAAIAPSFFKAYRESLGISEGEAMKGHSE